MVNHLFSLNMNKISFILLLITVSLSSLAQNHVQYGLYAEGGWFMPEMEDQAKQNGFSTGIGAYVSIPLWDKLSTTLGLGYRFKTNKNYQYRWIKFPQHYLVIPLKPRYTTNRGFFFEAGIEASRVLNYERINEEIEYNWLVGIGNSAHRLQWYLNYIEGFKEQGMGDNVGQIYFNHMLLLGISFPLLGE